MLSAAKMEEGNSELKSINRAPATYSHSLRVCLVILGIYSGNARSRVLSLASSFYHLLTCYLDTAFVIAGKIIITIYYLLFSIHYSLFNI